MKAVNLIMGVALFAAGYGLAWNQFRPDTPPQSVAEADVLARVGDSLITRAQFEEVLAMRQKRNPMLYRNREQLEGLLAEMVERESLLQAARRAGISEDPFVKNACDRAQINLFVQEKVEKALADTQITEAEIESYYEAHRDEFAIPARYKPAIILLAAPPSARNEESWAKLERQAREIIAQARDLPEGVTHWGELARSYSQHRASRYQGGAMAWVSPMQKGHAALPDPVLEALFSLKEPGDIAPPVRTDRGIYLVRLQAFEPARSRPLAEVRKGLIYRLRREKRETAKAQIVRHYLGDKPIETWPERLPMADETEMEHPKPPALPR